MAIQLYSKSTQRFVDVVMYATAWIIAFQIRFDGQLPPLAHRQMLMLPLPIAAAQIAISSALGIYRFQWRYVSAEDAVHITRAYLVMPLVLLGLRLAWGSTLPLLYIPFSVIAVSALVAICGALGARLLRRGVYERSSSAAMNGSARRFLLVGAGSHGATVAREMLMRKGIHVLGFVDDDPDKHGAVIAGLNVLGRTADLPSLVSEYAVDEVLVCIPPENRPSLPLCDLTNGHGSVSSRVIPTLEEVLGVATVVGSPALKNTARASINEPPGSEPAPGVDRSRIDDGLGTKTQTAPQFTIAVPAKRNGGQSNVLTHDARPHTSAPSPVIKNKTILITGGAGFIGSSLGEKLADDNELILLDQCFKGAPMQYTSLVGHPNVRLVEGDILHLDLRALVKSADVIIHTAAILGVNRVCSSGRETLETNYVGTSRLLKSLDAGSSIERFVYFSTSEVFGVNSYRVDEASRPTVGPIAESRWSYAMSKLAGEHLVASYFRETHLPIAIVRPFNIFGPRRTGDYVLRRFIASALDNEPLLVHGDGAQIRSWCYIEDFCNALLQLIARPEAIGEDFNIGNPANTLTVCELAHKVIQLAGSNSSIQFSESPFPDICIRVPSLEKARRLLAYEPHYDLNTGLKLTIDWYRNEFSEAGHIPVPSELAARASLHKQSAA